MGKILLGLIRFELIFAVSKIFQNWTWFLITMRDTRKMSTSLGSKLGLGTELVSFEKFWSYLVLAQISRVLTVFYSIY